ncbi:phage tail tape measure protein [Pararhizobium haloflavum]|uniref:phage tail tape measure protein n=1 Tax=Pararhizobium haloflavum TaxID=2037914 RepID=UPI000C17884D|nr:phage tail tape measure protein [Pararhizobium haloflavum]
MARLSSELVLSLRDRFSRPARGVENSLDRLERRTRRSQRLTAASAYSMGQARSMMLASVAGVATPAAIGLATKEVVSRTADFESALTAIEKKAGTTANETRALGEEIKDLATSGELAVPIEEIAAAYERGAAAGIPLGELREFARLSAMAADAFEMSAEDVGNAAAGFETNLDIPIDRMEKFFDLINGLADTGIADERDIVMFLDRVGKKLNDFGLANEQSAALGASLVNMKLPAEVAARAMDTLTTNLLTPKRTKQSHEAFEQLYEDADDFTELLEEDANGALLDFLKRVQKLDKFKRAEILTGILGQGFSGEVSALSTGMDELIRNLTYAAGNDWFGSLGRSYQAKLDDFWSQWQLLKNDFGELIIDVGTAGMPAAKARLQDIRSLINEISKGLESFETKIDTRELGQAQAAVGELAAAIGELMGMEGDESPAQAFFENLAGTINSISDGINAIRDAGQALGLVAPDDDTDIAVRRRRERLSRDVLGDRFTDQYQKPEVKVTQDRFADAVEHLVLGNEARTKANAERRAKRAAAAAEREAAYQRSRMTATQAYAISHMGDAGTVKIVQPGAIPLPTPKPDIAQPVEAEGVKALLKAEEIGHRISQAFSVTATPTIDATSIRAAKREADALEQALKRIGTLSDSVDASVKRSRIDYDGIHADTTYPGY